MLYDESSHLVYGIALRVLGNEADAEEITLDVYSQVWKSAGTFNDQRGSVSAWLSTLARSRAIDRFRARMRAAGRQEAIEAVCEVPSLEATPEQASFQSQRQALIAGALAQIPPEQRRAIELAYFTGLTQSELADYLGEPLGTIKTRIRLGMIRIREILGPLQEASA
jgi:RNA polymerase sigma-70 factor (ECF subfamily)